MNMHYTIGSTGSLFGVGYFSLSYGSQNNPQEVVSQLKDFEFRTPPRILVTSSLQDDNIDWKQLRISLNANFNHWLGFQTSLPPASSWDAFDHVILNTSVSSYRGEPANEVWLNLSRAELEEPIDLPMVLATRTQVWVIPAKGISRAELSSWLMRQSFPVRVSL